MRARQEAPPPSPALAACVGRLRPLHARLCPRQVLGVRMGLYAAKLLALELPRADKRVLAFVETDGCFADGVAAASGCWLGHRTMRLLDVGKVAVTFVDTETGRAVRVWPRRGARQQAAEYAPDANDRWHAQRDGYMAMPTDELLQAEWVTLLVPVAEIVGRPHVRVDCTRCGEEVINQREVLIEGRVYCRTCAGEPYALPLVAAQPRTHDAVPQPAEAVPV